LVMVKVSKNKIPKNKNRMIQSESRLTIMGKLELRRQECSGLMRKTDQGSNVMYTAVLNSLFRLLTRYTNLNAALTKKAFAVG